MAGGLIITGEQLYNSPAPNFSVAPRTRQVGTVSLAGIGAGAFSTATIALPALPFLLQANDALQFDLAIVQFVITAGTGPITLGGAVLQGVFASTDTLLLGYSPSAQQTQVAVATAIVGVQPSLFSSLDLESLRLNSGGLPVGKPGAPLPLSIQPLNFQFRVSVQNNGAAAATVQATATLWSRLARGLQEG